MQGGIQHACRANLKARRYKPTDRVGWMPKVAEFASCNKVEADMYRVGAAIFEKLGLLSNNKYEPKSKAEKSGTSY